VRGEKLAPEKAGQDESSPSDISKPFLAPIPEFPMPFPDLPFPIR
jgi:hypothetical protein